MDVWGSALSDWKADVKQMRGMACFTFGGASPPLTGILCVRFASHRTLAPIRSVFFWFGVVVLPASILSWRQQRQERPQRRRLCCPVSCCIALNSITRMTVAELDEQIERLRQGDTLAENEVKALCERVSKRGEATKNYTQPKPAVGLFVHFLFCRKKMSPPPFIGVNKIITTSTRLSILSS